MLVDIEKGRVFNSFFANNLSEVEEFRIRPQAPSALDAAFRIKGLSRAIESTCNLAQWRMIVCEHRLAGGNVAKEFALDLVAGPPEQELKLRYFPRVVTRGDFYPKQHARLYLNFYNDSGSRLHSSPSVITNCRVVNGSVIFGLGRLQREIDQKQCPASIMVPLRGGEGEVKFSDINTNLDVPIVLQPRLI